MPKQGDEDLTDLSDPPVLKESARLEKGRDLLAWTSFTGSERTTAAAGKRGDVKVKERDDVLGGPDPRAHDVSTGHGPLKSCYVDIEGQCGAALTPELRANNDDMASKDEDVAGWSWWQVAFLQRLDRWLLSQERRFEEHLKRQHNALEKLCHQGADKQSEFPGTVLTSLSPMPSCKGRTTGFKPEADESVEYERSVSLNSAVSDIEDVQIFVSADSDNDQGPVSFDLMNSLSRPTSRSQAKHHRTTEATTITCIQKANEHFVLSDFWTRFDVEPEQQGAEGNLVPRTSSSLAQRLGLMGKTITDRSTQADRDHNLNSSCDRMTISPSRPWRAIWDIMSVLFVIYECLTWPLQLFDPPEQPATNFIQMILKVWWTVDLVLSFWTGFITNEGLVERRLKVITCRYLRGWFFLDLSLVVLSFMDDYMIGLFKAQRASRLARLTRLFRLLRLFKGSQLMKLLIEKYLADVSDQVMVFGEILGTILVVLAACHLMACTWWGVGTWQDDLTRQGQTWVTVNGYQDENLEQQYMISLHWSLYQLTGGTDEITAQNTWERLFSIIMFVLGFVMSSVCVSCLTSAMTKLHFATSGKWQKLDQLRKYLQQHHISYNLMVQVLRNAKSSMTNRDALLPEAHVELFNSVSATLRSDVRVEIFASCLSMHTFFRLIATDCPWLMRQLCDTCMEVTTATVGERLFDKGERPAVPRIFFLRSGIIEYAHMRGWVQDCNDYEILAEALLWVDWQHKGRAKAITLTTANALNVDKFMDILASCHSLAFDPTQYAKAFVNEMNSAGDISDLPIIVHMDHRPAFPVMASMPRFSWKM
eukprot:TRINITY_DN92414_c0_g1_i1.p1 TRINITY_DN92414_c0_g1~~TRINITY_DN92414_c0_g1_i1.p1  ORF type:complete len:819 (+),score=151.25 TRINITY_DN92414_c0_g1_i1:169-2625(+)